ncbi:UNVERIFIED_CONTAM: NUDIX domain-containing protein, partial [Bacteroidetes bacterium 56_B9]
YALPGGHLEFNETFSSCAIREVLEETGLRIKEPEFLTATNDIMETENKHYVTIFMCCEREDEEQEAENLEVEKCEGWEWVSWEEMKRGW